MTGRLVEVDSLSVSEEFVGKIRPSKSDTSLTESFVVIGGDGEEVGEIGVTPVPPTRRNKQSPHLLREGRFKLK